MNAFSWIHLEIAEFVLMCRVEDIHVLALHKCLTCREIQWGSGSSSLVPRLTYISDYCINVYAQISMHNKISISLYPCVALYEVRDQVCSHFSSDCGGLSRPVAYELPLSGKIYAV